MRKIRDFSGARRKVYLFMPLKVYLFTKKGYSQYVSYGKSLNSLSVELRSVPYEPVRGRGFGVCTRPWPDCSDPETHCERETTFFPSTPVSELHECLEQFK